MNRRVNEINRRNVTAERNYNKGLLHGKILAFSECGFNCREISDLLQNRITYSAIAKVLRRNALGGLHATVRTGRPRITTDRANRLLVRLARRNRLASARQLLNFWAERVSRFTVYRRLREAGLRPYRRLRRPLLNVINRLGRLRWAQQRALWRQPAWDTVVWSDESRFCLYNPDGRRRVWREIGERFDDRFIEEHVQGNGGSIHVWAAIWANGKSTLQVLNHNVTGIVYVGVLQTFLRTSNPPNNFRFQDDNAPAHRARCVTAFKEANGITSLPWPSRSPDLNPIEHLWDHLGRQLQEHPVENLQQLRERLVQEWDAIPQATITNLVHSMTRRVGAVITAAGGHTRY